MRRAIELASQGQGYVEPNPMVGAVLVDAKLHRIGEGYHERIGEAHAEVNALAGVQSIPSGATLFVTLEPCNHIGKTPPCCDAILNAGINHVVIGSTDPAPHTDGAGIRRLRDAGVNVEVGLLQSQTDALIAPFSKRMTTGKPWVIAKWAMTLDGRIAARTGHSQWISSPESRYIVHQIRGRVDAIVVGRGTAEADNPLLTARPPGPRVARRVVLDRQCQLSPESRLASTASDITTLVFCGEAAAPDRTAMLKSKGVQVARTDPSSINSVLVELGQRGCTNILVEGGAGVLGSFFDAGAIDEAHVFIAPKLVGGEEAAPAMTGRGLATVPERLSLTEGYAVTQVGTDAYISGRLAR